jgi:hypothetical protein
MTKLLFQARVFQRRFSLCIKHRSDLKCCISTTLYYLTPCISLCISNILALLASVRIDRDLPLRYACALVAARCGVAGVVPEV